jgi:hypothetical protein
MSPRTIQITSLLPGLLALAACGSAPRVPQLDPLPSVLQLPPREAPPPARDEVVVKIASESGEIPRDAVLAQGGVPRGSRVAVSVAQPELPADPTAPTLAQARVSAAYHFAEQFAERTLMEMGLAAVVDVADIIRTPKDTPLGVDHVLIINRLTIRETLERSFEVRSRPEAVTFIGRNPGIEAEIPASMEAPTFLCEIDAKLVEASSGRILWTARYSADSLAALKDGIEVKIGCLRTVANEEELRRAIDAYNRRVAEADRRAQNARTALITAYAQEDEERLPGLQRAWRSAARDLEVLRDPPANAVAMWRYDYDVEIALEPDLHEEEKLIAAVPLTPHQEALIAHVVRLLLSTIQVTG